MRIFVYKLITLNMGRIASRKSSLLLFKQAFSHDFVPGFLGK
jgi:hypothetical protein